MILQIVYSNGSSKQVELPRSFNNNEWVKLGGRSFSPAHAIVLDDNKFRPIFKYSLYNDAGSFIEGATINPQPIAEPVVAYSVVQANNAKRAYNASIRR
jgi:hypothetical protein